MRSATRTSKSSKRLGADAERRVRRHFLLRGYRIVATNAWAGGNEIDLIVRRGHKLVFCEVKAKTGDRFGHPWEAVTPEKERRVRRAVEAWLARRPDLADLDVELETVGVRGRRIERAPIG
jgi:putative endonuclease